MATVVYEQTQGATRARVYEGRRPIATATGSQEFVRGAVGALVSETGTRARLIYDGIRLERAVNDGPSFVGVG